MGREINKMKNLQINVATDHFTTLKKINNGMDIEWTQKWIVLVGGSCIVFSLTLTHPFWGAGGREAGGKKDKDRHSVAPPSGLGRPLYLVTCQG